MKAIDHYELQAELGRGAAGVVYRAYDPRLDRPVALKLLLGLNERQRSRLRREARALRELRHPGVVDLHDVGEWQDRPYLVLGYVDGDTLHERIARNGPLDPADVIELGIALCNALEAVHAAGLLHRDIKPANVLIDRHGQPLLTDFGLVKLARALDESRQLTVSGTIQGTPGYWSPEQAAGSLGRVGPTSDVYSLGATLYAALTGRPPVDGDNLPDILLATARATPARPSTLRPDVPASLEAAVLRCLEKSPSDRFPSAAALAAALEGSDLEPQRHIPWRPILAGAAGVLGILTVAGALTLGRDEAEPKEPSAEPTEVAATTDEDTAPPSPDALYATAQTREALEGPAAAVAHLRTAAEAGSLRAMVRLGQLLSQHDDVPRDDDEATRWFRQAADAGDPQAMSEIGFMLAHGRGAETNETAAREWFRKAAEAGNPEGMSNYGMALERGIGGPRDPQQAIHWLNRAVAARHPAALVHMGLACMNGSGVEVNRARGIALLREAMELGQGSAASWLATYTRRGEGVPRDPARAVELYLRSASLGSRRGYTLAAQMLIEGDGVPAEETRGEALLRKGVEAGDPAAMYTLATYLEHGRFGLVDEERALTLYQRAADTEDPAGMFRLGGALARGVGGPPDLKGSLRWLRKAADAGYAKAQFDLGQACHMGVAPGGRAEARRLYRAAAAQGHEEARDALRRLGE